jgi:hypothetical protein
MTKLVYELRGLQAYMPPKPIQMTMERTLFYVLGLIYEKYTLGTRRIPETGFIESHRKYDMNAIIHQINSGILEGTYDSWDSQELKNILKEACGVKDDERKFNELFDLMRTASRGKNIFFKFGEDGSLPHLPIDHFDAASRVMEDKGPYLTIEEFQPIGFHVVIISTKSKGKKPSVKHLTITYSINGEPISIVKNIDSSSIDACKKAINASRLWEFTSFRGDEGGVTSPWEETMTLDAYINSMRMDLAGTQELIIFNKAITDLTGREKSWSITGKFDMERQTKYVQYNNAQISSMYAKLKAIYAANLELVTNYGDCPAEDVFKNWLKATIILNQKLVGDEIILTRLKIPEKRFNIFDTTYEFSLPPLPRPSFCSTVDLNIPRTSELISIDGRLAYSRDLLAPACSFLVSNGLGAALNKPAETSTNAANMKKYNQFAHFIVNYKEYLTNSNMLDELEQLNDVIRLIWDGEETILPKINEGIVKAFRFLFDDKFAGNFTYMYDDWGKLFDTGDGSPFFLSTILVERREKALLVSDFIEKLISSKNKDKCLELIRNEFKGVYYSLAIQSGTIAQSHAGDGFISELYSPSPGKKLDARFSYHGKVDGKLMLLVATKVMPNLNKPHFFSKFESIGLNMREIRSLQSPRITVKIPSLNMQIEIFKGRLPKINPNDSVYLVVVDDTIGNSYELKTVIESADADLEMGEDTDSEMAFFSENKTLKQLTSDIAGMEGKLLAECLYDPAAALPEIQQIIADTERIPHREQHEVQRDAEGNFIPTCKFKKLDEGDEDDDFTDYEYEIGSSSEGSSEGGGVNNKKNKMKNHTKTKRKQKQKQKKTTRKLQIRPLKI